MSKPFLTMLCMGIAAQKLYIPGRANPFRNESTYTRVSFISRWFPVSSMCVIRQPQVLFLKARRRQKEDAHQTTIQLNTESCSTAYSCKDWMSNDSILYYKLPMYKLVNMLNGNFDVDEHTTQLNVYVGSNIMYFSKTNIK